MSHAVAESLAVPMKGRGHKHRRSAAISLDWRHVQLPTLEVEHTKQQSRPASCSPTLTFASTLSDTSVEEVDSTPFVSTQTSTKSGMQSNKRVSFLDEVHEIPGYESGDTWMRPEDYSWPIPSADSKTILLDALEPAAELASPILLQVPGSPVLMHRKKRSSFLQSTKNALSRRPSKKRPSSASTVPFDIPIPAPKTSMIDLDLALGPKPSLRHKKSGSLGAFEGLLASPTKPKAWHKRADSAPADILFSFSPRPASPDSRKRKMSSILEHPAISTGSMEVLEVRLDTVPTSDRRQTGFHTLLPDEMIMGQPGDMISVRGSLESVSPAVEALKSHCTSGSRSHAKRGWKGMWHRLMH